MTAPQPDHALKRETTSQETSDTHPSPSAMLPHLLTTALAGLAVSASPVHLAKRDGDSVAISIAKEGGNVRAQLKFISLNGSR